LAVGAARAQEEVPSIDLRRTPVSTDPYGTLYLEPPATPGHLEWNVGVWGSYAHRVVTLEDALGNEVGVPVEHQVGIDYMASLGLGSRFALGVLVPSVAYQTGDDTRELVTDADALPKTSLGDIAITAKLALVPPGPIGGFSLALLGRGTIPTGNGLSYASDATATGTGRLLGEVSWVALAVRGSAGVLFRTQQRNFAGLDFGHELPWGVGLQFRPQVLGIDDAGRWQWNLESRGSISLNPGFGEARESPALIGLSARIAAGDFAFTAGGELPLTSAIGAPAVRGVLGIGYAPRFVDADGDEIGDERDECAELAEDRDGFEDADGCPDFDNDGDGVPDDQDKCAKELEDSDGFQDEDGCADPDNDRDGVPDGADKCPTEAAAAAPGAEPGCPVKDADVDGVIDPNDRCPAEAEDRDGHEDTDGCIDPDNDRDGVPDAEDACVDQSGPVRSDPTRNGCPSQDLDGDTYEGTADQCADQPEDFDGQDDSDGCPDPGGAGKPLARWERQGDRQRLVLAQPLAFVKDGGLEPRSDATMRAIAALLQQSPDTVLLVAVRPQSAQPAAEQLGLNRAFEIVEALRRYSGRDDAAETIGWSALRKLPGAAKGDTGFIVLSKPPAATP
jgi:hypothetical protein